MIQKGIQSHKHFKETFAVTKKIRVLVGLKFINGNWLTKQNKQQQQNFINKQIKLQKYCPRLARLFEEGQCVQNIRNQD